jgi:hypothetical protein
VQFGNAKQAGDEVEGKSRPQPPGKTTKIRETRERGGGRASDEREGRRILCAAGPPHSHFLERSASQSDAWRQAARTEVKPILSWVLRTVKARLGHWTQNGSFVIVVAAEFEIPVSIGGV